MDTLTIFCLGTSHERDEQWSIMRALLDLTGATEIVLDQTVDELPAGLKSTEHVSAIFDGPDVFFSSNQTLDKNSRLGVDFIRRYQPKKVVLFGHSRGAVLATMIAARTFLPPNGNTTKRFHLWLLDIVAHTHLLGGAPVVPASRALTAYTNVREIVRVVMEDEWNPTLVFPLEDFRVSDGKRKNGKSFSDYDEDQDLVDVKFIRLPGAHGNGTQVNPIAKTGDELPPQTIEGVELPPGTIVDVEPGDLWPIGEACLIHALDSLAGWGVPLTAKANEFRGDDRLLDAYARIRTINRRRADGAILLNDVAESRASTADHPVLQESAFHTGERSASALGRYGEDFQNNQMIVNEQHRAVLARVFGDDLAAAVERAGEGGPRELASSLPAGPADLAVDDAIDALHSDQPTAFGALVLAGAAFDGVPLFNRSGS